MVTNINYRDYHGYKSLDLTDVTTTHYYHRSK